MIIVITFLTAYRLRIIANIGPYLEITHLKNTEVDTESPGQR